MNPEWIFDEVEGLYQIITLKVFRRTEGVKFDMVPILSLKTIAAVDRVIHQSGAFSPGRVGGVARPWYLHAHQEDHLLVMHGSRLVELYSKSHPGIVRFVVTSGGIQKNGKTVFDGPAMLAWPREVFHRIESDAVEGSASLNFATRHPGYDARTNFNIYDLDPGTGAFRVIREGHLDQPDDANPG